MQRVTLSVIAQAAGVSKNTVSLALRNDRQIPEATRRRIQKIAKELGYQRNPIVAHLMAQLRLERATGGKANLALINANEDRHAFEAHPTIPTYVAGCKRRAEHMGYHLDTFWLFDPNSTAERLTRILKARGIRGIIIIGLMKKNRLPKEFLPICETYPCVVTGVRTREPALSFSSVDHYFLALHALEKALELGYRRPGLVLDAVIDDLVEGRFSAGYRCGQRNLSKAHQLEPFLSVKGARKDRQLFKHWLDKEKPDVVLTLYHEVQQWLHELGYQIPRDMGLIQLEWREKHAGWAGMEQHNDLCAEAAVDMLIGQIHRGESGVTGFPRATLISPSWVNGSTVAESG